MGLSLQ
ncbi:hypothetical protein CP8484711_0581A, partial [Chlamydia psittaci 84-8471/1]